jgi:hypothetical protein
MFLDPTAGLLSSLDMADNLVIDLTLESEAEDQVSAFSSGFYSKVFLQRDTPKYKHGIG